MPKPRPVARNADRNPNLGGNMDGKRGYSLPKVNKTTAYSYRMGPKSTQTNSIRDKNLKRMGSEKNQRKY